MWSGLVFLGGEEMKIYAKRKDNAHWILEELPFLTKLNYGTHKDYDVGIVLRYWIYDRTGILYFLRRTVIEALKGDFNAIFFLLWIQVGAWMIGMLSRMLWGLL